MIKLIKYTTYAVFSFFGGWLVGALLMMGIAYQSLKGMDKRYNSDMFDW